MIVDDQHRDLHDTAQQVCLSLDFDGFVLLPDECQKAMIDLALRCGCTHVSWFTYGVNRYSPEDRRLNLGEIKTDSGQERAERRLALDVWSAIDHGCWADPAHYEQVEEEGYAFDDLLKARDKLLAEFAVRGGVPFADVKD